jgi:DNA-directed RNA polymerase specialized sigma24 family protein
MDARVAPMAEVTEPHIADLAECIAAIEALSDSDLQKLKNYARFMAYSAKGAFRYADAEDLLHESVVRTLDGRRKWKSQQVNFATHMRGCIQSIADEYAQEARRYSDEELSSDAHASAIEPRVNYMIFIKTRSRLHEDKIATAVFDSLLEGHSPAEVREILNMDDKVYNAARKRISRCMQRVFSQWKEFFTQGDESSWGETHV